MNKRFFAPALALALMAFGFAGCSDDDLPTVGSLIKGTEFNFGAAVESNSTRTYYDPADVANPDATSWKIYWNYRTPETPDVPLDHIYIYSPQALEGRNQAAYTVNPERENQANAASVTKDGTTGVQTGTETEYDFYAMYPASAVKENGGTGDIISATMPIKQTAYCTEIMTPEPVGDIQTTADMNCALMIAKNSIDTDTAQNNVSLKFEPFATMVDITVMGPDANNTPSRARVSSFVIEANAPIAGDFTYNYQTKNIEFGENASNSISVETMYDDEDGNKMGVMMAEGSKLQVRAFLIPNPNVTELKVRVITSDSRTMAKKLKMTNFKPSQIHFVKLPKMTPKDFDYTIWLSQLDPNIYISEISLPGSALAFNYSLDDVSKHTQGKSIAEQFQAGARVFQFHVSYDDDMTSLIDTQKPAIVLSDSEGNPITESGSKLTLAEVMLTLENEMKGIHRDEFCVLCISDWIRWSDHTNAWGYQVSPSEQVRTLYSRLNVLLNRAVEKGVLATNVSPNTTIADVRGKMILKLQLNGAYPSARNELSDAPMWVNIYTDVAESNVLYSPMPFGDIPTYTGQGTSDTFVAGTDNTYLKGNMNIIYSESANPLEYRYYRVQFRSGVMENAVNVLAAYAANYDSNLHNNFSMTYLGGCGYSTQYSPSFVATELNGRWLDNQNKPTNKPWGWVLMNGVGVEETTTRCIEAIIEHNASEGFTLKRRGDNTSGGSGSGGTGGGTTTPDDSKSSDASYGGNTNITDPSW